MRALPHLDAATARAAARCLAAAAAAIALAGCLTTEYRASRKETAPAVMLDIGSTQPPLAVALRTLIVYEGPGSWKREALWDEYVVTLRNLGGADITVSAAALTDFAGVRRTPGSDPWQLEKESQTLEQRYLRDGIEFARSEIPDALVFGSGAVGGAAGTLFSGLSAAVSSASVVGLPVYYVVVYGVNRNNKATAGAEFARRRLVLPLTLLVGESRTGSLFLPMAPNPQSLDFWWTDSAASNETLLALAPLHGLHAAARTPAAARARP
jgi:hypothetical protein